MSTIFQKALSAGKHSSKQAIILYDEEIRNNPLNCAAWQNIGLCKLKVAKDNKDNELLDDGKVDFKKAIHLVREEDGGDYPIAEANLAWANSIKL